MTTHSFTRFLEFPSNPENARLVEDAIIEMAESCLLDDDSVNSLMIAVTEAANNAILHGNKKDEAKIVTVRFELSGTELTVAVTDEGSGFDPGALPDPLAEENLLKTSGRGVFLMKNIMKSVDYQFSPAGTTVTMRFGVTFTE